MFRGHLLGGRISLFDKQMKSCEEIRKVDNPSFDSMDLQEWGICLLKWTSLVCQNHGENSLKKKACQSK